MGWKKHFNVNFKRIAEVWLDGEYKETFDYYNQPLAVYNFYTIIEGNQATSTWLSTE